MGHGPCKPCKTNARNNLSKEDKNFARKVGKGGLVTRVGIMKATLPRMFQTANGIIEYSINTALLHLQASTILLSSHSYYHSSVLHRN